MRRRKKVASLPGRPIRWLLRPKVRKLILAASFLAIFISQAFESTCAIMLTSNCLSKTSGCSCSWKGGKFVANCTDSSLNKVPNNDHYDYLLTNAGNNQMPTLNRDIQQLNLASNNITSLSEAEFYSKKFRNLQKLYLNTNQLLRIHSNAFHKLTGLIELDLSENLISSLRSKLENEPESDQVSTFEPKHIDNNRSNANSNSLKLLSFLNSDLSQLRHLNLASNQLIKLEEFAFSQLSQLRQLILSRNRIRFIDKRAFDGLNVLNILHLDGNKLSHLDGDILLKLPQLHAIQLAGETNLWRCDCRLRKLVRLLLGGRRSRSALIAPSPGAAGGEVQTLRANNILLDEPRCGQIGGRSGGVKDKSAVEMHNEQADSIMLSGKVDEEEEEEEAGKSGEKRDILAGKLWTNMTLADFECPLELASQFMPPIVRLVDADLNNEQKQKQQPKPEQNEPAREEPNGSELAELVKQTRVMNMNDKRPTGNERRQTIVLQRRHYLLGELAELTCAFALTDELDLDLVQVEWWLLQHSNGRKTVQQTKLLSRLAKTKTSPQWLKDEPAEVGKKQAEVSLTKAAGQGDYIIIDYVTRANRTGADCQREGGGRGKDDEEWQEDAGIKLMGCGKLEERAEPESGQRAATKLIRIEHLIADVSSPSEPAQRKNRLDRDQPTAAEATEFERLFLCRITNSAGQLDVLYPITIVAGAQTGNQRRAQLEWLRRQALRRRFSAEDRGQVNYTAMALQNSLAGWPISRAKLAISSELVADSMDNLTASRIQRSLFIPIYLPDELVDSKFDSPVNIGEAGESMLDLADKGQQQQQQQQQQRPATRQTNATMAGPNEATARIIHIPFVPPANDPEAGSGEPGAAGPANSSPLPGDLNAKQGTRMLRRSLRAIALDLIGRYTSNQRALITDRALAEANLDAASSLEDSALLLADELAKPDPLSQAGSAIHRLRSIYRTVYAKYLDKWLQLAIGEASLLLAVCAGLLAGCLLTLMLIVRLRCSSAQRVADSAARIPTNGRPKSRRRMGASSNRKAKEVPPDLSGGKLGRPKGGQRGTSEADSAEDDQDFGDDEETDGGVSPGGDKDSSPSAAAASMDKPAITSGGSSSSTTNGSQRKLIASSSSMSVLSASAAALDFRAQPISGPNSNGARANGSNSTTLQRRRLYQQPPADRFHQANHYGTLNLTGNTRFVSFLPAAGQSFTCQPNADLESSLDSQIELVRQANELAGILSTTEDDETIAASQRPELILYAQSEAMMPELVVTSDYYDQLGHELHDKSIVHNCNDWPRASCDEATMEDSSSSLLLTSSFCPQTMPVVVGPPQLRSFECDSLLRSHLNQLTRAGQIDDGIRTISGPMIAFNGDHLLPEFPRDHYQAQNSTLSRQMTQKSPPVPSRRQNTEHLYAESSYNSPSVSSQAASSASSSFATNQADGRQRCSPNGQVLVRANQRSGQSGPPENCAQLEDALHLLQTSVGHCSRMRQDQSRNQ